MKQRNVSQFKEEVLCLKTLKIATLLTFFFVVVLLSGCIDKPAAIDSPHGSVPFGQKAYSPDGKMYTREVEPRDHGNIGIFDLTTDKCLTIIDVRQHPDGDYLNDLKGLAWSPDSKWIAVMYHHDGGGHISIVSVDTGQEIEYLPISKCYHNMEFSSDGTKINVGSDILDIR